jgi:hypothetical protein
MKVKIGLIRALTVSRPEFQRLLIQRSTTGIGAFSKERQILFGQLILSGITEVIALKVLQRSIKARAIQVSKWLEILNKPLNSKRFGTTTLSAEDRNRLIQSPTLDLLRKRCAETLRKMENNHATSILDQVFPVWRRMRNVNARMEPRLILAKWVVIIKQGYVPSQNLLRQYSIRHLKSGKIGGNKLTPEEQKSLLKRYEKARKPFFS